MLLRILGPPPPPPPSPPSSWPGNLLTSFDLCYARRTKGHFAIAVPKRNNTRVTQWCVPTTTALVCRVVFSRFNKALNNLRPRLALAGLLGF